MEMPEEGKNKVTFQNHHKQLPTPFIIYGNFEALTTKVEGPELDPAKSNTQRTQHHEACSYCYFVVRCDGQTEPQVEYRGADAAEHILKSLQEEESKIKGMLADPKAMRMTREDWLAFRTAETCHVCYKPLGGDSVRDHCHITGEYRGTAHNTCNLKLRLNTSIPVVFHNLGAYDSHLLMQAISKVMGSVSCIPNNMEKYISFSLGQLRFIDSAQFLLASIDKLVAANPPKAFQIIAKHEPNRERREILMRKIVYLTSTWTPGIALKSPNSLQRNPSTASSLMHISVPMTTPMRKRSGLPFGARPWETTATYTAAPTSCFWQMSETFRKTCLRQYGLDTAHYYTSPGLSWNALLKNWCGARAAHRL